MKPAIVYVRVSGKRQGRSGLGLAAQQEAVARFAEAEGYWLVETFVEVETGKAPTRSNDVRNWPQRSRPHES